MELEPNSEGAAAEDGATFGQAPARERAIGEGGADRGGTPCQPPHAVQGDLPGLGARKNPLFSADAHSGWRIFKYFGVHFLVLAVVRGCR